MNFYKTLQGFLKKSFQKYVLKSIFGYVKDNSRFRDKQTYFCRKVDKTYYNLHNNLQMYFKYSFLFNLLKAISTLIILLIVYYHYYFDNLQISQNLMIIMINSICLDSLKIGYNILMLKKTKVLQTFLDVAQILGYCQFIQNPINLPCQQIPYNIQSSVSKNSIQYEFNGIVQKISLMRQLKYCYNKRFKNIRNIDTLALILYQGLGILIFYISISLNQNVIMNSQIAYIYILLSQLSFLLQYLNLYWSIYLQLGICIIILVVFLISIPFIFIFQIWKLSTKKVRKNKNRISIFDPKEFKESNYEDKIQCIICWETLANNDLTIELPCNTLHIFHDECLKLWWDLREQTCPYCRARFGDQKRNKKQ